MSNFFDTIGGKKVAFIGAGVSHRELIAMFAKAGAQVTLCDKKRLADLGEYGEELMELGVKLSLGESYLDGLYGKDMILRTPGFDYNNPELKKAEHEGAEITSEMELFFEFCPCKKVAVTGSDGKTTTTSLIAAMYDAQGKTVHLGGNIGKPLLPVVDEIKADDIAVIELSSFQLMSMKRSPEVAVVTNVSPNHLDYHKNMNEYINAKRNILLYQKEKDVAVLGWDNELSRSMKADVKGTLRFFSGMGKVENGAFLREDGMLCISEKGVESPVISRAEISLRGYHNVLNLLAAFCAVMGEVDLENIAKITRSFQGVEHRIEFVREFKGVKWYNDSIASSPSRVIAGLRSFDRKIILIAGGYDKKVSFEPMVPDILEKVKILILTGQTAGAIEEAVRTAEDFERSNIVILRASNMADAVNMANKRAEAGDVVSLSPASSSFDAYDNFEARGRHFKELVSRLE